jgi:hypothetical protein
MSSEMTSYRDDKKSNYTQISVQLPIIWIDQNFPDKLAILEYWIIF